MKSSALYVKPFFAVVTTMTILILFQFSAAKAFAGGENEFIKLVKSGTPDQIQAAVDKGASLGVRDKNNDDAPPLCDAAQYNTNPEVISVLLKAGENLNDVDDTDSTALSCAAYANPNPDMISALIAAGAEVDRQSSKDGYTALMNAAQYNPKPEVITALLNAGANVNLRANSGYTPLMCAANNNQNPVVINILANHGGDVNAHEDHGFTPLIIAATVNRNPEIISALLRAGANINAQDNGGYSALIMAVWKNPNDEVISVLLDAGADVMMKSGVGTTALAYANPALQKTDVYQKLAVATQVAAAQGGGSRTQTAQAASGDLMRPGEVLNPGQDVDSPDGRFQFIYQQDGNLVLYLGKKPLWASGTAGRGTGTCIMQPDGNLVMLARFLHRTLLLMPWTPLTLNFSRGTRKSRTSNMGISLRTLIMRKLRRPRGLVPITTMRAQLSTTRSPQDTTSKERHSIGMHEALRRKTTQRKGPWLVLETPWLLRIPR